MAARPIGSFCAGSSGGIQFAGWQNGSGLVAGSGDRDSVAIAKEDVAQEGEIVIVEPTAVQFDILDGFGACQSAQTFLADAIDGQPTNQLEVDSLHVIQRQRCDRGRNFGVERE
jgi:hypothetical protein